MVGGAMPYLNRRSCNNLHHCRYVTLQTFDECVTEQLDECLAPGGDSFEVGYFKIIPYFCGQDDFCR